MRKIIDAHAHIVPARLLGETDERYPTTVLPYGEKLEWDGRVSQFMPDYIENSAFPESALIRCMDHAGIQRAVLMQSHSLSFNDDVAKAVAAYPERLRGAMVLEPASDSCLRVMRRCRDAGLTVVKFEMSVGLGMSNPHLYPSLRFDSPLFHKIWALSEELGLTMTIDPSRIGENGYQVEAISRMAEKFPGVRVVICHLGFPDPDMADRPGRYARWLEMTDLASLRNVWFDLAALPAIFSNEDYPYPSAMKRVREFLDRHSAARLLWGSDVPGTLVCATYRQLIDVFEKCPLFSDDEKERMFWINAETVYFRDA
jgi:predicted TIM-barrel fold metal-dependent hydrolase